MRRTVEVFRSSQNSLLLESQRHRCLWNLSCKKLWVFRLIASLEKFAKLSSLWHVVSCVPWDHRVFQPLITLSPKDGPTAGAPAPGRVPFYPTLASLVYWSWVVGGNFVRNIFFPSICLHFGVLCPPFLSFYFLFFCLFSGILWLFIMFIFILSLFLLCILSYFSSFDLRCFHFFYTKFNC